MSTIIVADGVVADRAGFITALKDTPYKVVADAAHGDALMEAVEKHKPWCVAMDLLLPGHADRPADGGVHTMKRVLAKHPKVKFLVIHSVDTAHLVMGAISAGGGSRVRKPFKKESLMEALAKLGTGQTGEKAVKQLAVRVKKSCIVHYKGADEGWLAKKRDGVTTDISEAGIGMQTAEKIQKGKVLMIEVDLPGEAPLKAKTQALRVEPVSGMARYDVGLAFLEMDEKERLRLKQYIMRTVEQSTAAPKR